MIRMNLQYDVTVEKKKQTIGINDGEYKSFNIVYENYKVTFYFTNLKFMLFFPCGRFGQVMILTLI